MKYYIVIASLIFFTACGNKKTEPAATEKVLNTNRVKLEPNQISEAGLAFASLEKMQLSTQVNVNGVIDVPPQNMVSISMPLGGYLKSTKLLPGMHINKGEIIAVMEDQQYIQIQQEYLIALAQKKVLGQEYERQKELNLSKATSDKVFQQAEANYKNQQVIVKGLSEKLKLISLNPDLINETNISRAINIYSPINGYVSGVNVNIGKYVNPSDVLFELVNPEDIHLALSVFEKDIDKLFIGQKVIAYTNNNQGKKYKCEVILIGKDVSHERSVKVHCHFDAYDKLLIPGTYMNASFASNTTEAIVLPEESVINFDNKSYVFIKKEGGFFECVEVHTGLIEKGFIEIINPDKSLINNQNIVSKGSYTLLMKMKNAPDE